MECIGAADIENKQILNLCTLAPVLRACDLRKRHEMSWLVLRELLANFWNIIEVLMLETPLPLGIHEECDRKKRPWSRILHGEMGLTL